MGDYGRRSPRFDLNLPVQLGVFEARHQARTTNVSRWGCKLDADPGVEPGRMVWMHLELPDGRPIEATAIVRSHAQDERGLEFSMFLRGSRAVWEDWIRELESQEYTDKDGRERRTHDRHDIAVVVHLGGPDGDRYVTENISGAGLYVRSDVPLPLDTQIDVVLHDPQTDESLQLPARVVRQEAGGLDRPAGVGLAWEITPAQHDALMAWVGERKPWESEE
jgi:hypothetical protein